MMKRWLVAATAVCLMVTGAGCTKTTQTSGEGKDKILWYVGGTKQKMQSEVITEINKKLSSAADAELELQVIDWGSYNDKMNMVISSGEVFDMCFTSGWTNNFIINATGGGFKELDDCISDTLKESIPDFMWENAKVDNKIYAVPNYQVAYYQSCLLTPKRLADKYQLDPSTIKKFTDIEPYLKKLKENEPDIYPLNPSSISYVPYFYHELGNEVSFLAVDETSGVPKLLNKYETPEYKEGLKVARDYYKKGYIRSDMLSAAANATNDTTNLKYGVWGGSTKPGGSAENSKLYGEEILEIPLATPYIGMSAGQSAMTAISKKSKNPEKAAKIIELMNTDKELFNMLCFGIEGKNYEKISANKIKNIPESGYDTNAAWVFGNQFNAYYTAEQEEGIWEETDKINRSADKSLLLGMSLDIKDIKSDIAKVSAVEKEYSSIAYGIEEPKPYYDEFMKKLKVAGTDKIFSEIEKQINTFWSQKK